MPVKLIIFWVSISVPTRGAVCSKDFSEGSFLQDELKIIKVKLIRMKMVPAFFVSFPCIYNPLLNKRACFIYHRQKLNVKLRLRLPRRFTPRNDNISNLD